MHKSRIKDHNHTHKSKSNQNKSKSPESVFKESPDQGGIQRSDELSPVCQGVSICQNHTFQSSRGSLTETSCYCWPREAGSDSIRPSPCEMPPPNHRPPFPGPESSQNSRRVEKHHRLARLAEWASTAPGAGSEGSVSTLISLWVWVTFWGGEWAVWQEKGKK